MANSSPHDHEGLFFQGLLESGKSHSTLNVYVEAIGAHHNTVVGVSVGSHNLIIILDLSFSLLDLSSCSCLKIVRGLFIWFMCYVCLCLHLIA